MLSCILWRRLLMFFYQLHHCLPDAKKDYEENSRAALMVFYGEPGDANGAKPAPHLIDELLCMDGKSKAMWKRLPQPMKLLP